MPVHEPRVILGDCLEVMAGMAPGSVDAVVTSPPYNLRLPYATYDDAKADADYVDWICAVGAAVARLLAPGGSFFLNLSGSAAKPWLPFDIIVRLRTVFCLQNHITWIKSIAIGDDSVGHYKPIAGSRFMHHNHEHVFHLTATNRVPLDRLAIGVPFKDKSNIARRAHGRDLRCRGNTWFIPYATVRSKAQKFNHPGTFPIELPLWCLYLTGLPSPVVLDPFAGTGSTLVAARRAGGHGIGIEVDPAYAAIIAQRLALERDTTHPVVLDQDEMAALMAHDVAAGRRRGLPSLVVSLQDRLNKTTGVLTLTASDLAQLAPSVRRQSGDDAQQERLLRIFGRHLATFHSPG